MNRSQAGSPDRHRILIVDDEEFVLAALRETLRDEGYETVCTSDPIKALEMVRHQQFAVFLVDQQMATLTGLEFLTEAKRVQADAIRILITAVLDLGTVIDAINKGEVYRFIVKPWLREELLVTIRNAVQRFELIQANADLHRRTREMNEQLAARLAESAESARRFEVLSSALHRNLERSLELCLGIVDAYHPTLGYQARQVRELCRAMAARLELSPEDRQVLDISAALHNLGLLSVPRQLIRKWLLAPEALSPEEALGLQHYPVLGQELARFVEHLEPVGCVIRAHRERFDGGGFPDGLKGDEIPWLSRLLGVATAYARQPGRGQAAEEYLRNQGGTQFDQDAVRAFLRALPHAEILRGQLEVLLSELKPGMVLAKGIYGYTGLLLVPAGQVLSEPLIEKLKTHNQTDPITQTLVVYG